MDCLKPLLELDEPLTPEDMDGDIWNAFNLSGQYNDWAIPPTSEEELKIYSDMINLVEGKVDPSTFDTEYLAKLRSLYRFSAIRSPSKAHNVARRIRDTLDIV